MGQTSAIWRSLSDGQFVAQISTLYELTWAEPCHGGWSPTIGETGFEGVILHWNLFGTKKDCDL